MLAEKAVQLQESLTAWAELESILGPGERIVFSLRIETTSTVVRDVDAKSLMEMAAVDFFTEERFSTLEGITKHQSSYARGRAVAGIYEIIERTPDRRLLTDCTFGEFLKAYPDSGRLYRIMSLGRKTLPFIVAVIQNAGIHYR